MNATALDRLKIAFVVHDYNRHMGHSRYVAELATRFKRDHDVHIFANTFEEPDPAGLTYHHVPAWRARSLTTALSFVLPATMMIGDGFDIVHAQGLCGLRHNVATTHFCVPAWCDANARMNGRLKWRERLMRTLITPLERVALAKRSTRRVIAISETTREQLDRYYGRRDGVSVIYHGTDLVTFHPRKQAAWRDQLRSELRIDPTECLALFVGGLQKGAAAAIRAVARVEGVRLVLVSPSDPRSDRLVAAAEGVEDRVVFHPASRQIERFYAAADVFLFPTIYEPYGMVITEAMASGLPVITSRSAGAAELIDHGVSGWLTAEPWNVDQIAAGLRQLAVDSARRTQMGQAARAAIEDYDWDRTATQTLEVYHEVIAETEQISAAHSGRARRSGRELGRPT